MDSALSELGAVPLYEMEIPDSDIADLAIPCFGLAKQLRKAPAAIAEDLASRITLSGQVIEVNALNGYLNFRMDGTELLNNSLIEILEKGRNYGRWAPKGIKINVEHTSTNPTGPIHVGRARNPIIGDTLTRCLQMCGYEVETEYYVNDVGKQVVLLTWGVNNIDPSIVEKADREKDDHALVFYYRIANRMMEEDPAVRAEVANMLQRFEDGDEGIISLVRETVEKMMAGLNETLASIGVSLDRYTWESTFIADGSAKEVVRRLKATPFYGEEAGASYLELSDFGIHGKNTRFTFTRSDGTTLYTTRDLAYHLDKFTRCDRAINVLGEDQKLGSQQLIIALGILGSEKKPEPMFYSFVSLPEGKMSTRKGTVVYLDDLIDEAVERAYEEIKKRRDDLSDEHMRRIADQIGVGAVRYNIVRVHPEKQLTFRWNEALNFDGNSGPFLQYSHARACSMLRKAGDYNLVKDASLLQDDFEKKLLRVLSRFPEVVRECGEERKIHMMAAYGQEVATAFNQFYAVVPVLHSTIERDARITLVHCTKTVLENILQCLGIGAPEEM